MKHVRGFVSAAAMLIASPSLAIPITLSGPFEFLDNRSSNDAGIAEGVRVQFGVNVVTPNGANGTTATANLTGFAPINLPNLNEGINANLFTTSVGDNALRRGPWTLNFANGANQAQVVTPSLPTTLAPLPFVTNVSVSGTGLQPLVSWTNTASSLDAVAIRIRDNGITATLNGTFQASVISLNYFAPVTTGPQTYQVPTGLLTAGHEYSIEIDQLNTRTPFVANSTPAGIAATFVSTLNQSRAFFDYSATANSLAASSVFLPTVGTQPNGLPAYTFQITNIAANTPVFIDPAIAIGYSYKIGLGDPNFASVTLPTLTGTTSYTIVLSNGQQFTVLPGQTFDFTNVPGFSNGVPNFEVLGIDPVSALNAFDPNAFVTELTFVGPGSFTGEMDPIAAAVPEPSTWAMMILGFVGIGAMTYRRRKSPMLAA